MKETDKKKRIWFPAGIIAFLLLVLTLYILYRSTMADNINITGLTRYTQEDFLDKAGCTGIYRNRFLFELKEKRKEKNKIPYVDAYYIDYVDKNTIHFTVFETDVIGSIKIMGNYFSFDKEGMVLKTSVERPEEVPLVTGLEFDEIIMFQKINVPRKKVFDTVLEIIRYLEKFEMKVNEISFGDNLEVTLYTDNLKVLLGTRDKYDITISKFAGVFKEASETGGILDMRNYNEDNDNIVLIPVGN